MTKAKVYVLLKDDNVYGTFTTQQAAKDKATSIAMGGWYEYGGDVVVRVDRATYTISEQTLEVA